MPSPGLNPCCAWLSYLITPDSMPRSILPLRTISRSLKRKEVALIGLSSSIVFPDSLGAPLKMKKFLAVACTLGKLLFAIQWLSRVAMLAAIWAWAAETGLPWLFWWIYYTLRCSQASVLKLSRMNLVDEKKSGIQSTESAFPPLILVMTSYISSAVTWMRWAWSLRG